jgi:hypothetical protein
MLSTVLGTFKIHHIWKLHPLLPSGISGGKDLNQFDPLEEAELDHGARSSMQLLWETEIYTGIKPTEASVDIKYHQQEQRT